jgi:hypothetical protein
VISFLLRSWFHGLNILLFIVQELERTVHDTQTVPDIKDDEERVREQEENKKARMADGWIFDNDANELIGLPCRRFFSGCGNDGTVLAYLPADKNEGMALWHVVHNDGDQEDLIEDDVRKACRQYAEGLHEDDEGGNEEEDDAGSTSESGSDEEESDNSDALAARKRGREAADVPRLWTTSGVRQRWVQATKNSRTVGDGKS